MSTQEQRERFTEWWLRKCAHEFEEKERFYAEQAAWAACQYFEAAAIERCAKVCEMERNALRENEAVWDANPILRPDEEYISDWESSACRGEEYAAAIRALLPKEE